MRSARPIHMYAPELEVLLRQKESQDDSGRIWLGVFVLFIVAMLIAGSN